MKLFSRRKKLKTVRVNGRKVEVVAVTDPHVFQWWQPSPKRYVVARKKDGAVWCGPWADNGQRWSVRESKWYVFDNAEEAEAYASTESPAFNFSWDVFEL